MTEDDARTRVLDIVGPAAYCRLEQLAELVIEENERQNLISRSSVSALWQRHILDSVQLIRLGQPSGRWIDIGTGGGFPGLAIAAAIEQPMMLVEPRRLRASFLSRAASSLGLASVEVVTARIELVTSCAMTISARAVAPIEKLLQAAALCATPTTRWVFPRGQIDGSELARLFQGLGMVFHVEQSLSASGSVIVVAEGAPRR